MADITKLPTPSLFSTKTTAKLNEVIDKLNEGSGIPPDASWVTYTDCDSGTPFEIQHLTRPVPAPPAP